MERGPCRQGEKVAQETHGEGSRPKTYRDSHKNASGRGVLDVDSMVLAVMRAAAAAAGRWGIRRVDNRMFGRGKHKVVTSISFGSGWEWINILLEFPCSWGSHDEEDGRSRHITFTFTIEKKVSLADFAV